MPKQIVKSVLVEIKAVYRSFMAGIINTSKKDWIIILALFTIVLFPRVLALGTWFVADETNWLLRSNNFREGLIERDFNATFQSAHPAVTTMWISTISYSICEMVNGEDMTNFDIMAYEKMGHVIVVSILTMVIYLLLVKTFNRTVAILSILLIAFSPLHLFSSRLIHQEAVVGSFMLISLLSVFLYVGTGTTKGYLVLSGLAAGLAFLTKIYSFLLIPFIFMFIIVTRSNLVSKKRTLDRGTLKKIAKDLVIWVICAGIVFIALWPAVWVAPVETVSKLFTTSVDLTSATGMNETTGRIVDEGGQDIFQANYYFTRILFLITPITLAFAALTLIWLTVKLRRREISGQSTGILFIFIFALFFVTAMSLSPKKVTRYILIYTIIMEILAGFGLILFSRFLLKNITHFVSRIHALGRNRALPKIITVLIVAICLTAQILSTLPLYPYYSLYRSPIHTAIFGPQVEYIGGDGEGIVETARYFNEKEDAEELTVAVIGRWRHTFKLFFTGNTTSFENATSYDTDFLVFYRQQYLQNVEPDLTSNYFDEMEPEHIIRIRGLTYVWVYPRSTIALSGSDILVSNPFPTAGENITITATVHNLHGEDETVVARFFDGDPSLGGSQIGENAMTVIDSHESTAVSTIWNATSGFHRILIMVEHIDPERAPISNDRAEISVNVA